MAAAEFWYEFASTYSYPAAMRVAALAKARGVELTWRPFLLGPIFAANGWRDSPFNIYPAKGRYMWRDMERICGALGLPLSAPSLSRKIACLRLALRLRSTARSGRIFPAGFTQRNSATACRSPIARRSQPADESRLDPENVFARAEASANKALLKAENARAAELGSSARPASSRKMAKSSGATTGSSRGSTGRRARVLNGSAPVLDFRSIGQWYPSPSYGSIPAKLAARPAARQLSL